MGKRSLLFLLILLVYCIRQSAAQENQGARFPKANERWLQVESVHFALFSQARQKEAERVVEKLERLRKALALVGMERSAASPFPTSIYLFKNDESFRPFIFQLGGRTPDLAGYFLPRKNGDFIAMSAQMRTMQVIFHEYIHSYMNRTMPGAPAWFNEGYAEYFSTFKSDEKKAEIGLPVSEHLKFLRTSNFIPIRALFKTEAGMVLYHDEGIQKIFYAQSWLLVHFLMHGESGTLRPKLWQYLALQQNGQAESSAFAAAFGFDHEEMLERLRQYLSRSLFNYVELTSVELDFEIELRISDMPHASVLARLGLLLAHQDQSRFELAQQFLQQALQHAPGEALAHEGLGFLASEQGQHRSAVEHFRAAGRLDSLNAVRHFQFGESLMQAHIRNRIRLHRKEREVQRVASQARAAYQRALNIDPSFTPALAGKGETFVYSSNLPAEGIASLEKALRAMPARMDVATNLMILYARDGQAQRADSLLNMVIRKRADVLLVQSAEQQRQIVELELADDLLQSGRSAEALELLDALALRVQSDELGIQIRSMRKVASKNTQADQFNRAMLYANMGKLKETETILIKLLASVEDEALKAEAERALSDLYHAQHLEKFQQAMKLFKEKKLTQSANLLQQLVADQQVDNKLAADAREALKYIRSLQNR